LPNPGRILDVRFDRAARCDKGPVFIPGGARLDPAADQGDLGFREVLARLGGRHVIVLVRGGQTLEEIALVRFAGDNKGFAFGRLEGAVLGVDAVLGFALLVVGAVASEALLGEDGADVAGEIDRLFGGLSSEGGSAEPGDDDEPGTSGSRPRPAGQGHGRVESTPKSAESRGEPVHKLKQIAGLPKPVLSMDC
jgi:hypothetical protein